MSERFFERCYKLLSDSDLLGYIYDNTEQGTLNKFKLVTHAQKIFYQEPKVEYLKVKFEEDKLTITVVSEVKNEHFRDRSNFTIYNLTDSVHGFKRDKWIAGIKSMLGVVQ